MFLSICGGGHCEAYGRAVAAGVAADGDADVGVVVLEDQMINLVVGLRCAGPVVASVEDF